MPKITVDEFNQEVMRRFHKKVLRDMEDKLNHHKLLAKYTKKTTNLNVHLRNIKFMEEVIQETKQEYGD